MGRRIDLHHLICNKIGSNNVYFQPGASVTLKYPCVVYRLDDMPIIHANNHTYHWDHMYQLTVIDRDPESKVREKIAELPTCRFQRFFVSDNLNHYVFRVYY